MTLVTRQHSRARACLAESDALTLDWQAELSSIPAPTGAEAPRAERMRQLMVEVGMADVTTDDIGNVIGWSRAAGEGPSVVVTAHLDTVFRAGTDVSVRREGSSLHGPGIADNARGLAALLALARAMRSTGWITERPIAFVATVGEEGEGDLRGSRHLFGQGWDVSAAIALDGAGDDRVVHAALGSRRYRVTFRGPGGHSWSAFGVPNPAHAAGALAESVAELPRPDAPRTSCSVTRLGGGTSINTIPEEAWVEIDLRSEGGEVIREMEKRLRAAARASCDRENARRALGTTALLYSVDLLGDRPSGVTPADHPLVQSAIAATRAIGRRPVLATASTDANIPIALGIPAIALGAGGKAGEAHRLAEWYDNTDGPLGLFRILLILAAVAGLDEGEGSV